MYKKYLLGIEVKACCNWEQRNEGPLGHDPKATELDPLILRNCFDSPLGSEVDLQSRGRAKEITS